MPDVFTGKEISDQRERHTHKHTSGTRIGNPLVGPLFLLITKGKFLTTQPKFRLACDWLRKWDPFPFGQYKHDLRSQSHAELGLSGLSG